MFPKAQNSGNRSRPGRAEAILGKQRHGPTGTVALSFEAEVTRFTNLADEDTRPP
jgi:replicative DNA helicase